MAGPAFTDGDPRYLLTGLLRCTCCNGALGPHTGGGRGRRSYYRCSAHHHRGLVGCRNGLRVLVDEVDRRVLDAVAKALAPETVKEAIQGAVALLTAHQAEAASPRGALTAELASVEARTRRLVDALAEGDEGVQAIRARLREEAIKRDRLTAEIERLEQVPVPDMGKLLAAVEERARSAGVLARHPQQARQVIRLLLGDERWDAAPFDGPEGRGYHFKATGDYRRLMSRELASITVGYFGSSKRCRMMRFLTRAVNGGHRCPNVVPVCRAILPISGARRTAEAARWPPKHAPGKHSPERHGLCHELWA